MLRSDQVDGQFNLSAAWSPDPWKVVVSLSENSYLVECLEGQGRREIQLSGDLKMAVLDEDAPGPIAARAQAEGQRYVVQRIHAHRQVAPPPAERHYLVQWGGYRDKRSFTWEPRSSLAVSAADILTAYERLSGLG